MEEQRNKQLEIVQLPDVAQVPITTSESTTRYVLVPPLAVDHKNMVVPRENGAHNTNHNQQDYNMLNSSVPNYANNLQWYGQGGETQGVTSNGHDLIYIGGGNNMFGYGNLPYHHNRPIEQIRNGYIPRFPGTVHHQATYNNGGHVQLHQQRFPYNNVDLGHERRRKDQSDQFVNPNFSGRHVRGRGIGSIGPMIRHNPIISNCSSGPNVDSIIVNAMRTVANHSVNGRLVEDGRNQRAQDVATLLQDFTNYNPNDLPGEHKQRDLDNRDHSTSK
ncbi:uncharacterized protein LOC125835349 [Solanum verrucosum]|uniref:uncharacterized protein LOC125835349 n=1 Tax=Solanum verrucosum TaxID=315347 RepID=UPI0020D0A1D5|nr:uncharacterized protein LOC125835349 [Solanum verrucosum]